MKNFFELAESMVKDFPIKIKVVFVGLIIFGLIGTPLIMYVFSKSIDADKNEMIAVKLDMLISVTRANNLDHVSKKGAEIIYENAFDISKKLIQERAHEYIRMNNISNVYRRQTIRDNMINMVSALENQDYLDLQVFRYNEVPLSRIMDKIDYSEVTEGLLQIMFKQESINHTEEQEMIFKDLDEFINNRFNGFNNIAKRAMGNNI